MEEPPDVEPEATLRADTLRDRWPILALAALKLVFHIATARGYGVFRDELYYIACGEHLSLGYVDHAPLIAWMARATRALCGDSLVALRLTPALAGAAIVLLTGELTRAVGGGLRAQLLACLCVIMAPFYLSVAHLFTMNAFEPLFWTAAALLLVSILNRSNHDRPILGRWLALGAVLGLGLLNKHSTLFFGVGVAVALLATRARRELLTRGPWAACLTAFAITAPNLLWEAQNGLPTLEFLRNARALKNADLPPLAFLREQVLLVHPFTLPVWSAGLVSARAPGGNARARPLGLIYATILVLFLTLGAKPYYLAPAYPMLFAAGATAVERFARERARLRVFPALCALLFAGGAALAPAAVPLLPISAFVRYQRVLGIRPESGERHAEAILPQVFADMFGWQEMVAAVARAHARLSPQERDRALVLSGNYGEAAALDFFGPRYGLPQGASGHNSYWMWGPGDIDPEVVIAIGVSERFLREAFEDVSFAEVHRHPYAMPYESDLPIFICRRPRAPIRSLWPTVKRYI